VHFFGQRRFGAAELRGGRDRDGGRHARCRGIRLHADRFARELRHHAFCLRDGSDQQQYSGERGNKSPHEISFDFQNRLWSDNFKAKPTERRAV
jgi:hypothetical protein